MELKPLFNSLTPDERAAMAKAVKHSVGHIRNVAYGKKCSADLAMALETYTRRTFGLNRTVTRLDLIPVERCVAVWPSLGRSKQVRALRSQVTATCSLRAS